MSYLSLNFGLIRKEENIKVDLPKNYGASQYIKRLPYISREDLNFQNSIIDIVNNRSDLRKCLLATSDYGRNIQENINSLVDGGKFNQAVVRRVLDQKNKGVFESPTPLSTTFKDAKKFDIENPIFGNLLTQVIANQVNDKTVRKLLGNIKDDEIQRRLDELRRDTDNNMTTMIILTSILIMVMTMIMMMIWMLMVCCINMTTSQGAQYQSQGHKNMKMSYCIDTIG